MKDLRVKPFATKRCILRAMTRDDAQDFYEIASNPLVNKYVSYQPHQSVEETKEVMETIFFTRMDKGIFEPYVVVSKQSGKMIGTCDFISYNGHSAEIGYAYHPDYWGQGIATEVLTKLVEIAFEELGIHRLVIKHMTENIASQRVIEKSGFKLIGVQRQALYQKGSYYDLLEYDLLREDL